MGGNLNFINQTTTESTFYVDKVVRNTDPYKSANTVTPLKEFQLKSKSDKKIADFSHIKTNFNLIKPEMNGFMDAIHNAYKDHYALKLSVSDFILMIGQGLACHMEKHNESLRNEFVDFEGKEKIKIRRDNFVMGQENDWSSVFPEFAEILKSK